MNCGIRLLKEWFCGLPTVGSAKIKIGINGTSGHFLKLQCSTFIFEDLKHGLNSVLIDKRCVFFQDLVVLADWWLELPLSAMTLSW